MKKTAAKTRSKKAPKPKKADPASKIRFTATLMRPRQESQVAALAHGGAKADDWTFLKLPNHASAKLPSRGQVSVEGTINGIPFIATLEPDGQGGHWLQVDRKLRQSSGVQVGESITLEIAPLPPKREPEPEVPADLRQALSRAPLKAKQVWSDITPAARRDFIHWISSGKKAETRTKRITTACDMLAKGKRRPCCFDRSGMYSGGGGGKNMSCPVAASLDDFGI